jgi:hypothetical protein
LGIGDAERDTPTGNDDYGSGTGLASLSADVAATRELLTLLSPVIDPVAPRLVGRADRELAALSAAIQSACLDGDCMRSRLCRLLSASGSRRIPAPYSRRSRRSPT